MANTVLGEAEFLSPRAIREYCNNGRRVIRPLYHELHVAAEELEMVLRDLPSSNPHAFGADSRFRARLVSGHLRRAAEAAEVCAASLVRTYSSFHKHFLAEVPRRQARPFDMKDQ